MPLERFGAGLRRNRKSQGTSPTSAVARLTQAQLAARAGTTQAVIARIEGGRSFTASLDLLDRIARALGGRLSVEFEGVRTRAA